MAQKAEKGFANFDEEHGVYYFTQLVKWPGEKSHICNNQTPSYKNNMHVHVFYNGVRAETEKFKFAKSLKKAAAKLANREKLSNSEEQMRKKFLSTCGNDVVYNQRAIDDHMARMGYFVLVSNSIKSASDALTVYRRKDIVEKAFDNCKDRLELRRTKVHGDAALHGTLFIQFIALIIMSCVHRLMKENGLFKNYTMQSLFDCLDVIERFTLDGHRPHYGEITEKQRQLYISFGVTVPGGTKAPAADNSRSSLAKRPQHRPD
jgi:hypothetical protein